MDLLLRRLVSAQLPLALVLVVVVVLDAVMSLGLPTAAVEALLVVAGVLGVPRPSELAGRVSVALHPSQAQVASMSGSDPDEVGPGWLTLPDPPEHVLGDSAVWASLAAEDPPGS